jgi:pilus assembly protein TadC
MADWGWTVTAAAAAGLAVLSWRAAPGARLARAAPTGIAGARARPRIRRAAFIAASALPLAIGLGWWAVPAAGLLGLASHVALGRLEDAATVRRRELLAAQLPQVCDLLAVCLEAGLPLRLAVAEVARVVADPIGAVLTELSTLVSLGADETAAWADVGTAEPGLAELGREVARTVGSGVALAGTLRVLGAEARRRAVATAQVRARRVGVRSVLPLMTCFLPSFLLLGVVPIIGGVAGRIFG